MIHITKYVIRTLWDEKKIENQTDILKDSFPSLLIHIENLLGKKWGLTRLLIVKLNANYSALLCCAVSSFSSLQLNFSQVYTIGAL